MKCVILFGILDSPEKLNDTPKAQKYDLIQ